MTGEQIIKAAENERLRNKCEDCAGCSAWKCDCSNIRREFAERLKDKAGTVPINAFEYAYTITEDTIDNLLDIMDVETISNRASHEINHKSLCETDTYEVEISSLK